MEKTEAARAHLAEPTERVIDAVIDGRRCAIGRAKGPPGTGFSFGTGVRTGIPTGWSDDRETRGDRESLFGLILS
jgi:hypothetical protein